MQPSASEPGQEQAPVVETEVTAERVGRRRRKMLIVAVVVAILIIAVFATWALISLGTGQLRVNTTTPFVAARTAASFQATITTPALVSAGAVDWQFGDGGTATGAAANVNHTYAFGGTFFVGASSLLSNGKAVNNSQALFPMQVGPAAVTAYNPLGITSSLGVIAINKSASSVGAPVISVGGTVALEGGVQQLPSFSWATESNPANNTWQNFTWQVVQLSFDFGDGSSPETATDTSVHVSHTYAAAGIYAVTLSVTTQNFTTWQYDGIPAEPTASPVSPSQTQITKVGQSIAVGSYALLTYAGSIINPGMIVKMDSSTGGVWTLDPAINYVGSEPILNLYETLLQYNGTQMDKFVPVIADALPTHSADFANYTFHIRQGLTFTDGQPVRPEDVKYSFTRTMLFVSGSPPTPGWLVSQFLVPTNPDGSWNLSYDNVNNAVTVDDAAQTVTFHLIAPAPPTLFYQVMASSLGSAIVSQKWFEQAGRPTLVWSEAGFADYQKYSFQPNWVQAWRYGAAGSGPFMVDYVSDPDAIVLKANPTFVAVPGVPAPTVNKVVIQYVSDDSTRELSLETGKADIASISTSRFGSALRMQGEGLVHNMFIPTMTLYWWNFNMEIYGSSVGPNSNPYNNHVPPNFFVDLNMRKAFFYAFNFNQYLNQILGNAVYHATFGTAYNGILPYGMPGYQNLSAMNVFDMNLARYYYNQTQWVKDHGWANSGFTLGLNVEDSDSVAKAAASMWAQNLDQLAPPNQIHVSVVPIFGSEVTANAVPHQNPMSVYSVGFGWAPDYPFPTDYTIPMLLPGLTYDTPYGGYYTATNGVNIEYFAGDMNGTNQVANLTKIYDWIADSTGPNATNVDQVLWDSQQANWMGANMTLYVPEFQLYNFVTYRTWISGMEKETNPLLGGQWLYYNFLSKTTTTSASSVQGLAAAAPLATLAFASPLATIALIGLGAQTRSGPREEPYGRLGRGMTGGFRSRGGGQIRR